MRGNRSPLLLGYRVRGLSPACAGNPLTSTPGVALVRSIPACAGELQRSIWNMRIITVYPRVCGEPFHQALLGVLTEVYPRVCGGNQKRTHRKPPYMRSIPGVCGGTYACGMPRIARPGSIPRVRGNPIGAKVRIRKARSIPRVRGNPE